jgi:DNA polymerase-1
LFLSSLLLLPYLLFALVSLFPCLVTGDVVLEWDYSKGQPTVPLVKDKYGSERRKAKILNFSIAYGKTVHGLAQDWGISKEEAQETLNAWYADRPEVKAWQEKNTRIR